MNKSIEITFGFLVIILVVVGFIVAGVATFPNKDEIANARTVTDEQITMPQDISTMKVLDKIKDLERNGTLPVDVTAGELGRANPFAPV
ncbi:MAG: hypothetical protein Q7S37_01510 [bacterium]|nr:hypothetical protein [bacterium]